MQAGKIAGVQFKLNNWFLALIFFFVIMGTGMKVFCVFAAVLWHELAHAAGAAALGYRVLEIELLPFGGVARIERINEAGSGNEIMMAAAGPLASLGMAAVVFWGMWKLPSAAPSLEFFLRVNIMLVLFNLLPALPLDGGRIVRALLALHLDFSVATSVVGWIGKLIALALLVFAGLEFYAGRTINITVLIAAVFILLCAKPENAAAGFRNMRVLANKKTDLCSRGVMPTVHLTAVSEATVRDILRLFKPEQYYIVLVVDKEFRLRGVVTETEVWESLPSRGIYAKIGDFI